MNWESIIISYILIVMVVSANYVMDPLMDADSYDDNMYKVKAARGVFISLFWPIALVGAILYGIWKLFYYAFFYREKYR